MPSFADGSDPRVKRWEAFLLPGSRRLEPLEEAVDQPSGMVPAQ